MKGEAEPEKCGLSVRFRYVKEHFFVEAQRFAAEFLPLQVNLDEGGRSVIVGTAGHIDHGKTALVLALTGKHTDRLKEEQARGISIDIDFAPLRFADGTVVGMVDVPGHERFVRNMVAGAAGIDAALLVVDAMEGCKPQTMEHLAILEMLGVTEAVIAITKVDLVDEEWLTLMTEDIRMTLADSPFRVAPIVPTSVKTGSGLDALRAALQDLMKQVPAKNRSGAFRLPIDRVFSIPGHGTVVTGTVWRGSVHVGDVLDCLPGRRPARVRGIQVHGQAVEEAIAGERAALNLAGIVHTELRRGDTVAAQGTLQETKLLDVRIRVLPTGDSAVRHRDRLHVHLGTAERVGRLLLLDADTVLPGDTGFAQLLLDKPLVCDVQDPMVLRGQSPLVTVAGARVLDARPPRLHRRKRTHILEALSARDASSPLVRLQLMGHQGLPLDVAGIVRSMGLLPAEAAGLLAQLRDVQACSDLPSGCWLTEVVEERIAQVAVGLLALHEKQRLLPKLPIASVHPLITNAFTARDVDAVLKHLLAEQHWVLEGPWIRHTTWSVALSTEETSMYADLLQRLAAAGFALVDEVALCAVYVRRDRVAKNLLHLARAQAAAVEIEPGQWLAKSAMEAALEGLQQVASETGTFTVAQVRDALGASRKTVVAWLEYLDRAHITVRRGDVRQFRTP